MAFLGGDTGPLERGLERRCARPPEHLEFERASVLRDKLEAIRAADAVRQMELGQPEDLDVFGLAGDELEAAVQVFHVRSGKVVGRPALFVDKVEDLTQAELIGRVLGRRLRRAAASGSPREVLVPDHARGRGGGTDYLAARRGGPGGRAGTRSAGPKRALLRDRRARMPRRPFVRHRLHRTSDHNSRARALESLQRELGLPDAPLRIECYDMSHLQGTDYVGSMVVFEDGLPEAERLPPLQGVRRPGQRRLRRHGGGADPAAAALFAEEAGAPPTPRPDATGDVIARRGRRFAYPPQLLLLDGGLGQLDVGVRVLDALGLTDRMPSRGPRQELRGGLPARQPEPIRLPRQSEGLYLLQRVRDEAHRFAISYHRTLRGKRMTGVPWTASRPRTQAPGPARRPVRRVAWSPRCVERRAPWGIVVAGQVGAAVFGRLHTPLAAGDGSENGRENAQW